MLEHFFSLCRRVFGRREEAEPPARVRVGGVPVGGARVDRDDFHALVRQDEAHRESSADSAKALDGLSDASGDSGRVAGAGAGVGAGAGAGAGQALTAGGREFRPHPHLVAFLPGQSWVDFVFERNIQRDLKETLDQIERSPKTNIKDESGRAKVDGVNDGGYYRKVPKAKHFMEPSHGYNGEWLVKEFKNQKTGEIKLHQTFGEYVFAHLANFLNPGCTPKTRIVKLKNSHVASKIITGFQTLLEIERINIDQFYRELEIAAPQIVTQSIILGDWDLFVTGNFGFVYKMNSEGEKVLSFRNIDFDRCGFFSNIPLQGKDGVTVGCPNYFAFIANALGRSGELCPKIRGVYLEVMLSQEFSRKAKEYFQINREQLFRVANSAIHKFFREFPEAFSEPVLERIERFFHYKEPQDCRRLVALANNLVDSIALQILYIKIWTVFISYRHGGHHGVSLEDYTMSQIEDIKTIKIFDDLQRPELAITLGIEQLAPIFRNMCQIAQTIKAAAVSSDVAATNYVAMEVARRMMPEEGAVCGAGRGK